MERESIFSRVENWPWGVAEKKNENKETVSWYQEEEKGAKNQYFHLHTHTQTLLFSSKYLYSSQTQFNFSQTQFNFSLKNNLYGLQGSGFAEMLDSTESSDSASSSSSSIVANSPLISALVAFAIAQSIKVFTTWYRERRWDLKQLFASGGMPSSHSATVAALCTSIGLQEGVGGSAFAVSLILTCIVMYDATGVRLQAGRQAEVLNQIVYELPAEHPLSESGPLRELLGHTPPQVIAGGLLGIVAAVIGHVIAVFT